MKNKFEFPPPRVTFVNIIQISTPVRLYIFIRQHSTRNLNIKQSLLIQYLSLIQQSKLADNWIGLSTDTG
jgi:hypothetical protein